MSFYIRLSLISVFIYCNNFGFCSVSGDAVGPVAIPRGHYHGQGSQGTDGILAEERNHVHQRSAPVRAAGEMQNGRGTLGRRLQPTGATW